MKSTMSLAGGIDTYSLGKRYQDGDVPHGRKVEYLQTNGWGYDVEHANECFEKGQILTIKEVYVGRSNSEVEFIEFPNKKFNTVMFSDVG